MPAGFNIINSYNKKRINKLIEVRYMIISASRRTDIPTYYSEWFMNRIKAGYVYARNPVNIHQISKISLSPDVVDGIVFWTKNPAPMLDKLDSLNEYTYYFQFTLNSYDTDVERNIPSKNKVIIPTFQKLSDLIGPDRVIWRYDPIFLNDKYTVDYHIRYYERLAKKLAPYTRKCIISFLDLYSGTQKNMAVLFPGRFSLNQQEILAKNIAEIAYSYGLSVDTCAEKIDLQKYGIGRARCVDGRLFERLLKSPLDTKKDKNQRRECGCIESLDIGAYNTCLNGCRYCYANHNEKIVGANRDKHNPGSPLLIGEANAEDSITERKIFSYKSNQLRLNFI